MLKSLLPLTLCSTLLLTACATSSSSNTANQGTSDKDFMDASVQELYKNVQKVYKTKYFALGIPEGWKVLSFQDQPLASSISVEKEDRSALVTIRVNKAASDSIDQSCKIAAESFKANDVQFTSDPEVQYGTCIINATANERDQVLWLREYSDDNSAYSITYKGDLQTVGEVLGFLVGNDKLMQLMVRPL